MGTHCNLLVGKLIEKYKSQNVLIRGQNDK